MKNNFEIINKLYKPYKYTIKGEVLILSCNDKNIVVKRKMKDKNLYHTYNYLSLRGFHNYAKILDFDHNGYNVYEMIDDNNVPYEQKAKDLVKLIALMHAKTSYTKSVDKNIYDEIYNDIDNNILYLKDYYSKMYDDLFLKEIFSPYENLFIDNYSLIDNALSFSKNELDKWYEIVCDNNYERVAFVHNNLKVDHLLKSREDDILISFDKSKIDTPILDLYILYKNEYKNLDFKELLNTYNYYNELKDYELKFFFILISIPDKYVIENDNFINLKNIYNIVSYISKTEELVRPYYFNNNEEE